MSNANDSRPREWVLYYDFEYSLWSIHDSKNTPFPNDDETVIVVERSALDAANAEIERLRKNQICDFCKGTGKHLSPEVAEPILVTCEKRGCVFAERDQAVADAKALERERDELREALEDEQHQRDVRADMDFKNYCRLEAAYKAQQATLDELRTKLNQQASSHAMHITQNVEPRLDELNEQVATLTEALHKIRQYEDRNIEIIIDEALAKAGVE